MLPTFQTILYTQWILPVPQLWHYLHSGRFLIFLFHPRHCPLSQLCKPELSGLLKQTHLSLIVLIFLFRGYLPLEKYSLNPVFLLQICHILIIDLRWRGEIIFFRQRQPVFYADFFKLPLIINDVVPCQVHVATIWPERIIASILIDVFPMFYFLSDVLATLSQVIFY